MANRVFRGPTSKTPQSVNLPVTGALLPGSIVLENGTNIVQAVAADDAKDLHVLGNRDFKGQDLATAYTSGDTGVAYEIQPGDIFHCRLAAATYAKGDPLSVGASGRLEASASGDVVIARFEGTAGAKSAGELDDVKIANAYVLA